MLLEAGHNQPSATWAPIQSRIAAFTRVCSYDRAGLGLSDRSANLDRDGLEVVADLATLLDAARETAPLILVGHSLGGAFVRLFAAAHPTRVVGLVLVDAVHEREFAAVQELLTPEQRALFKGVRPPSAEGVDVLGTLEQVAARRTRLMVPLVVVARGRPLADSEMPRGWTTEQRSRREALRLEQQADLATLSPLGELVFATESGHFVHHDQPDVVLRAIRKAVEAWRAR